MGMIKWAPRSQTLHSITGKKGHSIYMEIITVVCEYGYSLDRFQELRTKGNNYKVGLW